MGESRTLPCGFGYNYAIGSLDRLARELTARFGVVRRRRKCEGMRVLDDVLVIVGCVQSGGFPIFMRWMELGKDILWGT